MFANYSNVVSVVPSACPLSRIDLYHVPVDVIVSIPVERSTAVIWCLYWTCPYGFELSI